MSTLGPFITLEGGEGSGKSTLGRALSAMLRARGKTVVTTREPGGSTGADAIRGLLVTGAADRWSPLSEALLFTAARNDHLERTIRPARAAGSVVICDRYLDSTMAYQVGGHGLAQETGDALARVIDAETPDLTLLLDLDPKIGLARSRGVAIGEGRYEGLDLAFHERVRAYFHAVAQREPQRVVVLDATQTPEDVARAAERIVVERFA